ncbi:protein ASPARTIC PROTEASE IN GUARD CELL 2-like [Panicum miliaceum]|uniref:Protein ASPARTIC PROTEASE IN GUARD CELL 2-like n=1 Tax=Panicum miliaceum TaxID=4540 RepID=A0A3L6S4S2_PANMI|nr:protein ASPARTIC PROTEASE IN GUARD CELL 2-like [Panicum miliaceum]
MASAMPLAGLLLLCLLVTHTHGSRPVLLRSTDDSGASPSSDACRSIASGHGNGNKLPLVHRLSPCSPLGGSGARKHGKASLDEILHRDGLRLRYLSEVQAAAAASAPAPAPSATPASGLSVPATQNVISSLPGVFDYTVLAGYGTPAQQLPLYFDVSGMSNFRCKPCFSGSSGAAPCDRAFDPSLSSSFSAVPCGSPDCRQTTCSSGSSCTFTFQNSTFVFGNGTVVTDTLTLSPSATFEDFAAGCMQLDNLFSDGAAVGNIDLSRSRHSLATRVLISSPPSTAAFSYCLPADTDTHGFLNIAPALSDYSGLAGVKYVPLVTNPSGPNFYYVDLVAITIDGKDLPIPPVTFRGNGTMIDSQSAFTYLNPPIYAALRDEFRRAMAKYPPAPAFSDLDTCYNFTGLQYIELPEVTLRFGNGETMDLDDRQFMYFFREHLDDDFPFGCLAFAASPDTNFPWNLLGSQVQRTKEIVYDVRGGMVAFVPSRCGLR